MNHSPMRVAKFEKVPYEQFCNDMMNMFQNYPELEIQIMGGEDADDMQYDAVIQTIYDTIKMPKRSTKHSAGYDIRAPFDFTLDENHRDITIPTGLRCDIVDDWFLDINPRSGSGFKFGVRLANTRGIIDADYYGADNYGHIMIKLTYESNLGNGKAFVVKKGDAFAQGIFTIYGITVDDEANKVREGGMGSTG